MSLKSGPTPVQPIPHKEETKNTAAEVIKVLLEKSLLEMTPDRVLQGRIYSSRHPSDIILSGALV